MNESLLALLVSETFQEFTKGKTNIKVCHEALKQESEIVHTNLKLKVVSKSPV